MLKKLISKELKISPVQIIPASFFITIMVGTLILMHPAATVTGQKTDFLTALFTATTSICVTGLVVVDTFSHWSLFGQIIILILIQFPPVQRLEDQPEDPPDRGAVGNGMVEVYQQVDM